MRDAEQKRIYFVGRAGDIRLDHMSASRQHACLEASDSRLVLRDLGSRNGTYEIRGNTPVPFSEGEIYLDQVFAFGVCVRSVRQMLAEVGATGQWLTRANRRAGGRQDPSNHGDGGVQIGSSAPTIDAGNGRIQAKLAMLVSEACVSEQICESTGIDVTVLRERKNVPDFDRTDQIEPITALENEIGLLREMLANVSRERDAAQRVADLSLERIELQEMLIAHIKTTELGLGPASAAGRSGRNEGATPQTPDGLSDLTRRYFVPKHR